MPQARLAGGLSQAGVAGQAQALLEKGDSLYRAQDFRSAVRRLLC